LAGTSFEGDVRVTRLKSYSKFLSIGALGLALLAASLIVVNALPIAGLPQEQRVNSTGAAVKGFLDRANAYVALQKKEDDGLPKLAPREDMSPLEVHQRALAARVRIARADAKPGDIFGDAGPLLREIVLKDAQARPPKDKKAVMEEVPRKDPLKINSEYPEKSALATVPPILLEQMPRLPEGLEYRFMGRDLVLRDTKANLIADFINEAVPTIKR
jgi:hypothetical protein